MLLSLYHTILLLCFSKKRIYVHTWKHWWEIDWQRSMLKHKKNDLNNLKIWNRRLDCWIIHFNFYNQLSTFFLFLYNWWNFDIIVKLQLQEWIRTIVANRVADGGKSWSDFFSMHNSGTYNNQWMVIDYKLFKPKKHIRYSYIVEPVIKLKWILWATVTFHHDK